jgi:hypothetical protein
LDCGVPPLCASGLPEDGSDALSADLKLSFC